MTAMQEWAPDNGSPERVVNENFDSLGAFAVYANNPALTTALTWGYFGGRWSGNVVDAGTLTLADDSTNYIVAHRSSGVVSVSSSVTNWNNTDIYGRIYTVETADGLVEAEGIADYRSGQYGIHGQSDALGADTTSCIIVACGDEVTAIAEGVALVTFRMPYAFFLYEVRASLTSAQDAGSVFTVDIKADGVSILSPLLTIDNTEKTSKTAATPTGLIGSPPTLDDDAEITIDVTQVGTGTATGLKVTLIGRKL